METWRIVDYLEHIFQLKFFDTLINCTNENFQYTSDFEDIPPLNKEQYQSYLEKQFGNFSSSGSLKITDSRCCKKLIEIILKKDTRRHDDKTSEGKTYIELFSEPRLMQCEIENGKICRMHLCSPENQRIPDGIQNILLESCKRNDIDAAKKAIEKGGVCRRLQR